MLKSNLFDHELDSEISMVISSKKPYLKKPKYTNSYQNSKNLKNKSLNSFYDSLSAPYQETPVISINLDE